MVTWNCHHCYYSNIMAKMPLRLRPTIRCFAVSKSVPKNLLAVAEPTRANSFGKSSALPSSRRFIYLFAISGGLADQANTLFSRSQTAETLWNKQMQSSNQKIRPDVEFSVLEVLPSSSPRAVLVKCRIPAENRETLVLLLRSTDNGQFHKGQEINAWRPWSMVNNIVFCTRFAVVT